MNSLKTVILFSVVKLCVSANSQEVNFDWAGSLEGTSIEGCSGIEIDENGNCYLVGDYNFTIDLDPGVNQQIETTSNHNTYIVKLDQAGNLIWAKTLKGSMTNISYDIILDNNGDILLTGTFNDSVDFDPGPNEHIEVSNAINISDAFLLKLDSGGNFVWVKITIGSLTDKGFSIGVDDQNNIYCSGTFIGDCDLNPGAGSEMVYSNGDEDIFIQKLDQDGDFLYGKSLGSVEKDYIFDLDVGQNGDILLAGRYSDSLDFDPNIGEVYKYSTGNGFLLKLSSAGEYEWVRELECEQYGAITTARFTVNDNIYAGGYFKKIAFLTDGQDTIESNFCGGANHNSVLYKMNNQGELFWGKSFGGVSGYAYNFDLDVDSLENVYGVFYGSDEVEFNTTNPEISLSAFGWVDLFCLKYNSNGAMHWVKQIGTPGGQVHALDERDLNIFTHSNGSIYYSGLFNSTVDFDPSSDSTFLFSADADPFILKLGQSSLVHNKEQVGMKHSVYPNPTSDFFYLNGLVKDQPYLIVIYNINGDKVFQQDTGKIDSTKKVDVSILPNGLYFIKVVNSKGEITVHKLIIN